MLSTRCNMCDWPTSHRIIGVNASQNGRQSPKFLPLSNWPLLVQIASGDLPLEVHTLQWLKKMISYFLPSQAPEDVRDPSQAPNITLVLYAPIIIIITARMGHHWWLHPSIAITIIVTTRAVLWVVTTISCSQTSVSGTFGLSDGQLPVFLLTNQTTCGVWLLEILWEVLWLVFLWAVSFSAPSLL